jgi:hypothetical protein
MVQLGSGSPIRDCESRVQISTHPYSQVAVPEQSGHGPIVSVWSCAWVFGFSGGPFFGLGLELVCSLLVPCRWMQCCRSPVGVVPCHP